MVGGGWWQWVACEDYLAWPLTGSVFEFVWLPLRRVRDLPPAPKLQECSCDEPATTMKIPAAALLLSPLSLIRCHR